MINYTLVGILCSVVGNFLISFAFNIQKYAHTKLQRQKNRKHQCGETSPLLLESESFQRRVHHSHENDHITHPYHTDSLLASLPISSEDREAQAHHGTHELNTDYLRSPYWWFGAVIMTVGETGNFIAYGFAPVSIVSPLGIVTIISNCSIAPLVFNEPIKCRDILGTVFASFGVLLVIFSSLNKHDDKGGINDDPIKFIHDTLTSSYYFYYVIGSICAATILIVQLNKIKSQISKDANLKRLYAFGNIFLVAIFGAHTALATKCLSTLIEFGHSLKKLLKSFDTYYLICVLILTAVYQIKFLNNSLQVENSTTVIPIHFVFFTISVLIGSAIVFHDQDNKNALSVICFLAGCVLTFVAVFLIVGGSSQPFSNMSDGNILFQEEPILANLNIPNNTSNISIEDSTDQITQSARKLPDDFSKTKNTETTRFLNINKKQFYSIETPSNNITLKNPVKKHCISLSIARDSIPRGVSFSDVPENSDQNANDRPGSQPLSRSTSIVDLKNSNTQPQQLNLPKIRIQKASFDLNSAEYLTDNDSDIHSSRSLPSQKKWDFKLSRRFLNRSRSFNRIFDPDNNLNHFGFDQNTELVGNGGNLIFNYVLSNLRDNY